MLRLLLPVPKSSFLTARLPKLAQPQLLPAAALLLQATTVTMVVATVDHSLTPIRAVNVPGTWRVADKSPTTGVMPTHGYSVPGQLDMLQDLNPEPVLSVGGEETTLFTSKALMPTVP